MKLRQNELDGSQIGDFDSIESTIRSEDLGLALTMVSKNLYSNPVGSFIRELVSNAVDANVDANEQSPVLVEIYEEDGIEYIDIKDNGTGMSPEIFSGVYMSWFNSDKRDTNKKIGGWGLGSKSPLAYQDSFEIITRYNGTMYHYMLANEQPRPKATLILEEATTEPNGTTIRVELKDDDSWKVYQECVNQLAYFDNVYVRHESYFYDNNFKIFDGGLYKLRSKDFPYGNEMHIVLGQVAYPIDWNVINSDRIDIPVALTFEVGDLEVTLSREEINYTDKVKTAIEERIEKVHEELMIKYEKQLQLDDLFEYIKLIKDSKKPPLKLGTVEIPMTQAKRNIYFTPFEGAKIKGDDVSDLFSAYNVTELKNGKHFQAFSRSSQFYFNLYRHPRKCYIVHGNDYDYFESKYIENGVLFKRGKMTKSKFITLAKVFDLIVDIGYDPRTAKYRQIVQYGASAKIHKILKYIDNYVKQHIQSYEGNAPDWWIEEQKNKTKEKRERVKGEVTVYNFKNNRRTVKILDLVENNKYVFFIDKTEDRTKILAYHTLYENLGHKRFKEETEFIVTSPTTSKKLIKNKNVVPVSFLFKVGSFRNHLHKMRLSKGLKPVTSTMETDWLYFSSYYNTMYLRLKHTYNYKYKFIYNDIPDGNGNKDNYIVDLVDFFDKQLQNLPMKKGKLSMPYLEYVPILMEVAKKAELLNYIKMHNIPHPIIARYIRTLKVLKFDAKYYDPEFYIKLERVKQAKEDESLIYSENESLI